MIYLNLFRLMIMMIPVLTNLFARTMLIDYYANKTVLVSLLRLYGGLLFKNIMRLPQQNLKKLSVS